MARYELRPIGVFDKEVGRLVVPTDPSWGEYLATLAAGDTPDPQPQPEPVEVALEVAIAERVALVDAIAAQMRREVVGTASAPEMSSWWLKLQEAQAFRKGGEAALEGMPGLLTMEAVARGVSIDEIATRVLDNASAFVKAEALIAGIAGKHKDEIRALKSVGEVASHNVKVGWPKREKPKGDDAAAAEETLKRP